jgi:hypothetical protein
MRGLCIWTIVDNGYEDNDEYNKPRPAERDELVSYPSVSRKV